jgi:hypothetical protein
MIVGMEKKFDWKKPVAIAAFAGVALMYENAVVGATLDKIGEEQQSLAGQKLVIQEGTGHPKGVGPLTTLGEIPQK